MSSQLLLSQALEAIEAKLGGTRPAHKLLHKALEGLQWLGGASSPPPLLRHGCVHEWLGVAAAANDQDPESSSGPSSGSTPSPAGRSSVSQRIVSASIADWSPPLAITTHVAVGALREDPSGHAAAVWIGRRCWPYPHQFARAAPHFLDHCLFVDPPDIGARLWAIDLALRSPGVAVVIADGSGLDMAASRRLQLAAESGAIASDRIGGKGGLGLLVRPWRELSSISAAWTRWLVRREPTIGRWPRWRVELLRNRASTATIGFGLNSPEGRSANTWIVEWDRADTGIVIPAGLGGGTRQDAGASHRAFSLLSA